MFVRRKVFINKDGTRREYLQIVESYRINGKPRQQIIATLGRVEELLENGKLDRLIEKLAKFSEIQWVKMNLENAEVS